MKKTAKIIAMAAACLCLVGAAGCSTSTNSLTVDSYWYIDSYEGIQPTSIDPEENGRTAEVLLYELNFDSSAGGNGIYRVDYFTDEEDFENGENAHYFKTTFYATTFDWSDEELTYESYRLTASDVEELDEADKKRMDGTAEVVYVLITEMEVSGQYVYGEAGTEATDDNSVQFTDYMRTITYFRSARNTLEPVYSRQEVHTTSPASLSPVSADDMCAEFEYEYEVFYNFDCTEATYTYTLHSDDGDETEQYTVDNLSSYSPLFDNNTIYTVVRGMSLSDSFSATVNLFTPANFGVFAVSITGGEQAELDAEDDADIIEALTAAYGQPDAEDDSEDEEEHSYIYYNPVSITSASDLHGTTQTAWFAAVSDENDNTYRATMLRLAVPLSYGLGTMEYRLAEVVSILGANAGSGDSAAADDGN